MAEKVHYEVWAKPKHLRNLVRIRVYGESSWQTAMWTASVLPMLGYASVEIHKVQPRGIPVGTNPD